MMASTTDEKSPQPLKHNPFEYSRLLRPNYSPFPNFNPLPAPIMPPTSLSQLRDPIPAMSSLSMNEDGSPNVNPGEEKAAILKDKPSTGIANGTSVVDDVSHSKASNQSDPAFVKTREADDVFGNNSQPPTTCKPKSPDVTAKSQEPTDEKITTPLSKHAPRADRVGSPITPANAQGVLPPEACVFVANLSVLRTDEQLEFSCHEAFDLFGECVVKVRRDRHRHPFALVQYHNIEDANRAVQGAHDLLIDGRHIRTEPAQAKRSVVLTKLMPGILDAEEARAVLGDYGPIDKLYPITLADAQKLGVANGMCVEFAYYLDYKDALKNFNSSNDIYHVQIAPEPQPKYRPGPHRSEVFHGFRSPRSTADQKSIFLGNLPHDTTEVELRNIFMSFGEIKAVNIIHKPIHGSGYNVFGFIEYGSPREADQAAQQEIDVRGQRIRVEPKEYSARRHTRLQQYSPVSPWGRNGRYGFPHMNAPFGMHQASNNHNYYHGAHGYGMHHGMNAYQHGGYNIFHTPPSGNRMPPRRNNMSFSGSPHSMRIFTPASLLPPPFNMDQADDINYGGQHTYQGNSF